MSFWRMEMSANPLEGVFPRSFIPPTQRGVRKERPWFWLVTCLSNKFIFMGGAPIVQNIDAASICHIQSRLCFSLATMESFPSISQRSVMISTTLPSTLETESGNCKNMIMSNCYMWFSSKRNVYLFTRSTFKQERDRVLLFASPMAYLSIILAGQLEVPEKSSRIK